MGLRTVGAHDVATVSSGGRTFAFVSNDKDESSPKQKSELFEWVGLYPRGRFESVQTIETDGAHAATFFSAANVGSRLFLAVANLGDREKNSYRGDSAVYSFDPAPQRGAGHLNLVQRLPTRGATDFHAFRINGDAYLAVSNEQDDMRGGDILSTIWALNSRHPLALPTTSDGGGGSQGGSQRDEL